MSPASWVRNGTVSLRSVCVNLAHTVHCIRSKAPGYLRANIFLLCMRESRVKGMSAAQIISQGLEIELTSAWNIGILNVFLYPWASVPNLWNRITSISFLQGIYELFKSLGTIQCSVEAKL